MLPTRTLCVVRARTFCCSPASHAGDAMRKQVQPRRVRVAANGRARAAARLVLQELRARQPVRAMPCCSEPLLLCPVAVTLWLVACCTPCGMLYEALRHATRYAARCLPCAILRAAMPQTLSLRVRVRAQSAHACACDRESLRVQVCALARGCARVGCSSSARLRVARCHIGFMCAVCEHGKPGFPEYLPPIPHCTRTYARAHTRMKMGARSHARAHITRARKRTHPRTHARVRTNTHTHTHMHTHAHPHTHTHAHARARTPSGARAHTHGRRAQLPRAAVPLQGVRGTAGGPRP